MTTIQLRRGTAAAWTAANPTLAAGETGFETDTGLFKIGDGATAWTSLSYAVIPGVAISALPAVTVPAGTDEFVVNQGGVSKKVTLAQVAAYGIERVVYGAGDSTWSKPAWAKIVRVECWAGGGGGGSGRRGATDSTNRCGGGGGGSGGYTEAQFLAADLPDTVNITVSAGGAGGDSVTTDDTNGNAGVGGTAGRTYFGASATAAYVVAVGAGGGAGGTNATSAAGGSPGYGAVPGVAGATGTNAAGTARSPFTGSPHVSSGGGGGGGVTTATNAEGVGGTGSWPAVLAYNTSPANGGAVHGNGGPGVAPAIVGIAGASGGGGGGGHAAAAGNGGDGTAVGAGGGGGGGSTNGFASGKGGNGGPGQCIVTSYG